MTHALGLGVRRQRSHWVRAAGQQGDPEAKGPLYCEVGSSCGVRPPTHWDSAAGPGLRHPCSCPDALMALLPCTQRWHTHPHPSSGSHQAMSSGPEKCNSFLLSCCKSQTPPIRCRREALRGRLYPRGPAPWQDLAGRASSIPCSEGAGRLWRPGWPGRKQELLEALEEERPRPSVPTVSTPPTRPWGVLQP